MKRLEGLRAHPEVPEKALIPADIFSLLRSWKFHSKRKSLTLQESNFIDHQSCVQTVSTYYPNILGT